MREIKFRGKSKLGMNPYVKGFLLIDEYENRFISFKPDDDDFQLCPVFEESVGQFTGIKDKNGIEIYEGDVYHQGDENIKYKVVWHDSGFIGKQLKSSSYSGIEYWKDRIEVLGNGFENPEFL